MSYESPIEILMGEFRMQQENEILTAIQGYNIRVDKDELVKALAYDRNQYEKGYADGYKAFNRRMIEGIRDIITNDVGALITAWSQYSSELFMQGKAEGGDLVFRMVQYIISKVIEEYGCEVDDKYEGC